MRINGTEGSEIADESALGLLDRALPRTRALLERIFASGELEIRVRSGETYFGEEI